MADRIILTGNEFAIGIQYLRSLTGIDEDGYPRKLTLPGGIMPMNGSQNVWWADLWNNYIWNPYGQADVSAKPAWVTVVNAVEQGKIANLRKQIIRHFDNETERRISLGYGKTNFQAETFFRQRASEASASAADKAKLAAGNIERDRLRTRFAAIETWINGLTTLSSLLSVNLIGDYWVATWTPPE